MLPDSGPDTGVAPGLDRTAIAAAGARHFLDLDLVGQADLRRIVEAGKRLKAAGQAGAPPARPLAGKTLAMIFEKPSTRTRVSFEQAVRQLGGDAIVLERESSQLGRGETVADTARVLSRYVDAIMLRCTREEKLLELAANADVPVINGLTDRTHPCQIMADVMTFEEHRGPIAGRAIAWSGDGNNMATSWIHAAVQFGFELRLATPAELPPPSDVMAWAAARGARVHATADPVTAVSGADCVVTDVWISMGDTGAADHHNLLAPYRVNSAMMAHAGDDAIFMHCLPAHRGEEVTAAVIDGPQSVVWDEAENRLHAQKGILLWALAPDQLEPAP
ncbi:MAG: ornithine carbamoyltransferase [Rhodospirillaceae bacterium]|nr:ornithine carbamoyltransferase [Rhodospirillaceae bacterium]MYH37701.1 ornithine carbamoyltransferase [Rhodospirillaceae bacterium]MYK14302.1 ornithine carbamoyltransferase [Rhodospirillaceae bacterium]MYK58840.1 ornithine carbamoyltransferase [Rhodospirillaceae bacterium]